MRQAICHWAAVWRRASLKRPRNADEFDLEMILICFDNRITMTADIDERKVGRKPRVTLGQRQFQIARSL